MITGCSCPSVGALEALRRGGREPTLEAHPSSDNILKKLDRGVLPTPLRFFPSTRAPWTARHSIWEWRTDKWQESRMSGRGADASKSRRQSPCPLG